MKKCRFFIKADGLTRRYDTFPRVTDLPPLDENTTFPTVSALIPKQVYLPLATLTISHMGVKMPSDRISTMTEMPTISMGSILAVRLAMS